MGRNWCEECSEALSISGEGKIDECTFVGHCVECGDSVRGARIEATDPGYHLCDGCVENRRASSEYCPPGWRAALQWVRSPHRMLGGDAGCLERAEEEAVAAAKALCIVAADSLSSALECAEDKAKEAAVAEQGRRFLADASLAKAAWQERAATPKQQGGGGN